MSARKAGRSDEQLARDELRATRALTDDDIPRIADAVKAALMQD